MNNATVLLEIDNRGIAWVSLNRPEKHNAFNEHVIAALTATFKHLSENDKVRALVLSGKGKSFCAGADLDWMKRASEYSHKENMADARHLANMLHTLNTLPFPTLAKVHGAIYGGGVGLAACCDMAFATPSAKFSISEVKLGVVPGVVSPYLIAVMGARHARRYFLTAEVFDAHTACNLGLVTEVVEEDAIDEHINSVLKILQDNGPAAMAAAKALVFAVANRPIDDKVLRKTSEAIATVRASPEGREGVKAFLEKRPPAWRGE